MDLMTATTTVASSTIYTLSDKALDYGNFFIQQFTLGFTVLTGVIVLGIVVMIFKP